MIRAIRARDRIHSADWRSGQLDRRREAIRDGRPYRDSDLAFRSFRVTLLSAILTEIPQ
jgi:hypothetical protein